MNPRSWRLPDVVVKFSPAIVGYSALIIFAALNGQWVVSAIVGGGFVISMGLEFVDVRQVQQAIGGLLVTVPLIALVAVFMLLHPHTGGQRAFFAAAATAIPTSLIAVAVSGPMLAARLYRGADLGRVVLSMVYIGWAEFTALRWLYRDHGSTHDVVVTSAGLAAAFGTVLVAALVRDLVPPLPAQASVAHVAAADVTPTAIAQNSAEGPGAVV